MLSGIKLEAFFTADADRFNRLSFTWNDWLVDLSKERWTPETIVLLTSYARGCELEGWIGALFAGEKVNISERRPALHTALRQDGDRPLLVDGSTSYPGSAPCRRR
jgi:glucose-6-phosphate isomerase